MKKQKLSETKPDKISKKEQTTKEQQPGVISTIVETIEKAGKTGVSKAQILDALTKKFPDRPVKSMEKTVSVQVPNRISKEKFKVTKIINEQGVTLYYKS